MDEQPVQSICSRTGWMNERVSVKHGEHISFYQQDTVVAVNVIYRGTQALCSDLSL